LQQQEIGQAGGFESFEQHHLVFPRQLNGGFYLIDIRGQRFLANHMFFVAEEQRRLREMQ